MNRSAKLGSVLFGVAMMGFATLFLVHVAHRAGPVPGPPWTLGGVYVSLLTSMFLFATGGCLATGRLVRPAAGLLCAFLLLRFAVIHFPGLIANLHNPGPWTSSFEVLGMCGGAMVLAASGKDPLSTAFRAAGFVFFAALLVVVGVQHFLYANFVSTLIPAWIPQRLFLAYFVGVAFFATALSLLTRVLTRVSATLAGVMFVIFVLILHIPRVAHALTNGNEWTSLFVALATAGVSFILAGIAP